MKTKDLIKSLREADPSGEEEVCVGGIDIHFVHIDRAHWDGCYEVLKRDPSLLPYYDVVGGEIRAKGKKVVIVTLSIDDVILDHPDMPVTFDSEFASRHYAKAVEKWRQEAQTIV